MQSFFDWFTANQDTLTKIGATAVVVIGALWQLYLHLDARKERRQQAAAPTVPIPVRIEVTAPHSVPAASVPRHPVLVLETKYRPSQYSRGYRYALIFSCVFAAFWNLILFYGVGTNLHFIMTGDFLSILAGAVFVAVPMGMLYAGMTMFMQQLTTLFGKITICAASDMFVVSRSLGFYSDHWLSVASHQVVHVQEWRFDGETFVSRRHGGRLPLPDLPDHIRAELFQLLSEHWS